MSFPNRLKELRESRNLTQKQVADGINMAPMAYQKYEYGTREPAYQKLIALADYFGVSLDYLTGRTDCPDLFTYDKNGKIVMVESMASDNKD